MPVPFMPGSQFAAFFDTEDSARKIFDKYTSLLSQKPQESMEVLRFDDIMGSHCLRPDFFPCCSLFEHGPCDLMWAEIDKKMKASQQAAGATKNMGFKTEEKNIAEKEIEHEEEKP